MCSWDITVNLSLTPLILKGYFGHFPFFHHFTISATPCLPHPPLPYLSPATSPSNPHAPSSISAYLNLASSTSFLHSTSSAAPFSSLQSLLSAQPSIQTATAVQPKQPSLPFLFSQRHLHPPLFIFVPPNNLHLPPANPPYFTSELHPISPTSISTTHLRTSPQQTQLTAPSPPVFPLYTYSASYQTTTIAHLPISTSTALFQPRFHHSIAHRRVSSFNSIHH